jgi:hypothetical protein
VFLYIALTAWTAALVGLLGQLARVLRRRPAASARDAG